MNLTPAEIVRKARNAMSQEDFGVLLGKSQSTICKYESDESSPPRNVIIRCMNMLDDKPNKSVSIDELVTKVKELLKGENSQDLRSAMMLILENLVLTKKS